MTFTPSEHPLLTFTERIKLLPIQIQEFYAELSNHINSFCNIKSRASMRCESYRHGTKLIAKIAIGGKTLKLFLALDITAEDIARIKINAKDVSATKAYIEVPYMVIIRSELAVKKACVVISQLMRQNKILSCGN